MKHYILYDQKSLRLFVNHNFKIPNINEYKTKLYSTTKTLEDSSQNKISPTT